jgi:hypothetical protein
MSVRHLTRMLGTAAVGALAAGAFTLGTSAGTVDRVARPQRHEELQLGEYCRDLFGELADAYQPRDIEAWRCSAWRNGVWGLEQVDLAAACRWQAGPAAELESTRDRPGDGDSRSAAPRLACAT